MTENNHNQMISHEQPGNFKSPKIIVRIFISLVILGAGIGGASYLKNSAPKTQKRPPAKPVQVVQIQTLQPSSYNVILPAMGTVIPAREIVLKSQVSGEIIEIHP
jgi:multidrug efflux pump subunit AcrA (membrane-fusion protein)